MGQHVCVRKKCAWVTWIEGGIKGMWDVWFAPEVEIETPCNAASLVIVYPRIIVSTVNNAILISFPHTY
jgi:hypothetical protein